MAKQKTKAKARKTGPARDRWSHIEFELFRDDVNWATYMAIATETQPQWSHSLGFALGGQMARITYEGLSLLRQRRPTQATSFELQYGRQIATARHSTKLLDNSATSLAAVAESFSDALTRHGHAFRTHDFAVMQSNNHVYYSSLTADYEGLVGDPSEDRQEGSSDRAYSIAYEMGSTMGSLYAVFGAQITLPTEILPLGDEPPHISNGQARSYLGQRYSGVPVELGAMLITVESAVNNAYHVFTLAQHKYPSAVFRAQFVIACHALSPLETVADSDQVHLSSPAAEMVEAVLFSAPAQTLRSNRRLRNQCMHYGIDPSTEGLSTELPFYGVVEATTSHTFTELRGALDSVLADVSKLLASWPA